jgi:transposase
MREKLRFLGLDVHAETIAVAVAEPDGEVRSLGTIANREDSIRKFIRKLGSPEHLRACYEASPTGFVLYWQLTQLGVKCDVIAPSLVPKKPGDKVKNDRRDALKLARSHRSDDLTAVWVPDEASEALRDLVRAREAAKQDQLRARHRLSKFLLRTGRRPPLGVKAWTERHAEWLQQVRYTHPAQEATLLDCLNEVEHMGERVKRLEKSIVEVIQVAPASMQEVVRGLQALRGIAHISAVTIAVELGNITSRFESARDLMGIAEHFRTKTPAASVFEEEALPSQATRTSDESWSNRPGAIATDQQSELGCAGARKEFQQRLPRLHGKRRTVCTSATWR